MRTVTALAVLAALCLASPSIAKPKRKAPAPAAQPVASPQVAVVQVADGWRADLSFDGRLLGWAVPRTHGGHRALLALVGPLRSDSVEGTVPCGVRDVAAAGEAGPARLYRWRDDSPDRLELVGSGLPEGALDAVDLDGDGEDELLLQREGRIDVVTLSPGGGAGTRALVSDDDLGTSCCGPRVSWDAPAVEDAAFRVGLLGAFRTYRRGPDGTLTIASEQAVPTRVTAHADRVLVRSPIVTPIGRAASGRMLFATEPEPLGKRRLRTMLLDPDGPSEPRAVESWALFPEAERVVDRAFLMLDGSPVLVVTTTAADKLSLLGDKALRVYPLNGDRTRAGNEPIFAATTGIHLWQQASPAVVDLDKDGHQDLVLTYWEGLKNSIAALEVYRGVAASVFSKAHTMSFDVANGDKGFAEFGPDLDGDGRPDLILLANKELLVFPGNAPDRAVEKPVANVPSRRIALPANLPGAEPLSVSFGTEGLEIWRSPGGLGTPHFLDLDGDGRPEAVFAGDAEGGGRAVVVFVKGSAALAPSAKLAAPDDVLTRNSR